jgi:dual specificity tyrosine-phosphorylation-regulated kinase 2/3/4
METFGDRFPDGYDKIKLLGRGGFSLVWLGEHKKSKKKYAIKQIITESNHETHKKEIWFGEYFFDFGGVARAKFLHHPGIKNLVKLYYYFVNKKDTWLLYEKCGDSLGNALYELKGENYNG